MLRHGHFSELGPGGHRRPFEPRPPPEFLEDKLADQAVEIERIARENHKFAETHESLRQELLVAHQEMRRLQAHLDNVHTESDIQIKRMLEKIGKIEADVHAGEMVEKELQQSHLEARSLFAERQELMAEVENFTKKLQEASNDIKNLPELHPEMDLLRQEHQKLRDAFEYEKGSNMEQVERMQAMENNLISMAGEVSRLRADITNAEKRASAPSPDPVYPAAGQGSVYMDRGYDQRGSYGDAGYGHAGGYTDGGYSNAYGRPQAQMTSAAASSAGYSDGYGRSQDQTAGGEASGEGWDLNRVSGVGRY